MLKTKKTCRQCGTSKPLSEFYRSGSGTRRGSCKQCVEDQNRWVEFGVKPWDYWNAVYCFNGRCQICKELPGNEERLVVDHNHTTGAVRGLLCKPCNLAIGLMKDKGDRLLAASVYLEESSKCAKL